MDAFVLVGILTVLSVIAQRARAPVRGVAARSLRALLPSWRFFDRVADAPTLSYRLVPVNDEPDAWRPLPLPRRARTLPSLLLQPSGNLRLAYLAIVTQLLSELSELPLDDHEAAARLVSYQLTENLVRSQLPEHERTPGARVQFKVHTCDGDGVEEQLLVSKIVAV